MAIWWNRYQENKTCRYSLWLISSSVAKNQTCTVCSAEDNCSQISVEFGILNFCIYPVQWWSRTLTAFIYSENCTFSFNYQWIWTIQPLAADLSQINILSETSHWMNVVAKVLAICVAQQRKRTYTFKHICSRCSRCETALIYMERLQRLQMCLFEYVF